MYLLQKITANKSCTNTEYARFTKPTERWSVSRCRSETPRNERSSNVTWEVLRGGQKFKHTCSSKNFYIIQCFAT